MLGGRYRLVHPVAEGGMAHVWEAVDEVLTRAVAVKILHGHLAADEAFRERFRREAVAAARLSHPAIVATYDTGEDGDLTFIVMELVRGRTLRDLLRDEGALAPDLAVRVAGQTAGALAHAHAAGLTHRDIKPANILLCEEIAPDRVKIADFGIAKAADDGEPDLTQTGAIVGSARYLAPEQAEGGQPDARSDLYALGVVLFEMLTGRVPFDAGTDLGTALAHVKEEPPRPRRLRPGIPRPLEDITLRLLAKSPDDRFASAGDLQRALEAVDIESDDAEVYPAPAATPPGGTTVTARPARRPVAPLAVVGAVVLAAVVAAVVVLGGGAGDGAGDPGGSNTPVAIAQVTSFDPEGSDKSENEREAPLAADGDRSTVWTTDRYQTRAWGNLKEGVGLVFRLGAPSALNRLDVISRSEDWGAAVYVSDGSPAELSGWGEPVAAKDALAGTASFDLGGAEGSAVLLWITDPGSGNRATIAEVTLSS